jgi:leucyl-tRNA synthetase
VINPDIVVSQYGADSLRLYVMFMGPLEQVKPWSMKGVEGVHRFLNRVWRVVTDDNESGLAERVQDVRAAKDLNRARHALIKKVTEDIEGLRFNTAIAAMMEFLNLATKESVLPHDVASDFTLLLSPFAPHLAEELWSRLGHSESLAQVEWPAVDEASLVMDEIELPVQVNGKVRGRVTVPASADQAAILTAAREEAGVKAHLEGKAIAKEIVVPGRLVNFVVK